MPLEREAVLMARAGGTITKDKVLVTVCAVGTVVSVAVTTTEKVPVTVGVPLIAPAALMVSPAGRPVAEKL